MVRLLVFHMHGCPHCRSVVGPEGLAASLADVADVYELEAGHQLCGRLGVSAFPSFAFVADGGVYGWRRGAPRTYEALSSAARALA